MVIPKELETSPTNRVTHELVEQAQAKAAAEAECSRIVPVATLREAARLAALQTELRLLGDLASAQAVEGLQPYITLHSPALSAATIVRSERDARFHMPPMKLEQVLNHFGAELDRETDAPSMLIVVAHQDDETIGAGAQLARLPDVTVLHVTDGAPRDPSYAHRFGYASVSEYAEVRRREAADALRLAGVPDERQLCLNIPDGEAPYHLVELSLTIAELIDELGPEVVLTHPYEGGHTDHDAIAFAVHLACGILRREGTAPPLVLELTSYHNRNGQRVAHEFLPYDRALNPRTVALSRPARELKARMYDCFGTQRRCLEQFSVDIERFRPAPRYIFTRPPHDGPLDYERLSCRMSYSDWRTQAQRALSQLRTHRHGRVSMAEAITVTAAKTSMTSSSADTQFIQAM